MNKVIAVDFDGTLCENKWPQVGAPRWAVIYRLLDEKANGASIILWTCREGELLKHAVEAAASWGIQFDAINDSLPSWKTAWKSDPRKIGASEYWDDKAVFIPMFGALPGEGAHNES